MTEDFKLPNQNKFDQEESHRQAAEKINRQIQALQAQKEQATDDAARAEIDRQIAGLREWTETTDDYLKHMGDDEPEAPKRVLH